MNWLIRNWGVRDYAIGVLIVVLFSIVQQWHGDRVELQKAKLVYDHPQIKYVDRIVEKLGPIRIKTVIVKEPSGAETTEITEDRGETTTETLSTKDSAPIGLDVALKEPRTDRYLVSIGVNKLSLDSEGKAIFVGYGWKNRFDLQVGGMEHNGFSPWALATFRF